MAGKFLSVAFLVLFASLAGAGLPGHGISGDLVAGAEEKLESRDPETRLSAVASLEDLGTPRAVEVLQRTCLTHGDPKVVEAAEGALYRLHPPEPYVCPADSPAARRPAGPGKK